MLRKIADAYDRFYDKYCDKCKDIKGEGVYDEVCREGCEFYKKEFKKHNDMEKEELKDYIKNNLEISVDFREGEYYLILSLEGEKFSEVKFNQ